MSVRDDAIAELARRVQANIDPVLDSNDLASIIDSPAVTRAARWTANTSVRFGLIVLPTADSGFIFTVSRAGTTGAIEPVWPTDPSVWSSGITPTVSDGSVLYDLSEAHFASVYSMRVALERAWALKLAKATEYIKSEDGEEAAIYEHCKEMTERYRRPMVA